MLTRIFSFIIGKSTFRVDAEVLKNNGTAQLLTGFGICNGSILDGKFDFSVSLGKGKRIKKKLEERSIPFEMKSFGLLIYLEKLVRRKGILFGIIFSFLLNILFSNMIFDINIEGSEKLTEKETLSLLSHLGVYKGAFYRLCDNDRLTLEFLLLEDRVVKMHMNMIGTSANITLSDRTEPPKLSPDKKDVVNIVAKCDGTVVRADIYSGGREIESGNTVSKGQLLISSFFETRTSGYILRRAKGSVFARTEPIFEIHIPKEESVVTDSTVTEEKSISFLSFSLPLKTETGKLQGICESRSVTEKNLSFFGLCTPFYVKNERFVYNVYERRERTPDKARKIFEKEFEKIERELSSRCEIIDVDVEESESDEAYIFRVLVACIENICTEIPCEISEPISAD